jgi:hypothetical protein
MIGQTIQNSNADKKVQRIPTKKVLFPASKKINIVFKWFLYTVLFQRQERGINLFELAHLSSQKPVELKASMHSVIIAWQVD